MWIAKIIFALLFGTNFLDIFAQRYQLISSRNYPHGINVINLFCRDTITSLDTSALFWLNGSDFQKDIVPNSEGIIFLITRQLEGDYTCGRIIFGEDIRREESAPITLVGKCLLIKMYY